MHSGAWLAGDFSVPKPTPALVFIEGVALASISSLRSERRVTVAIRALLADTLRGKALNKQVKTVTRQLLAPKSPESGDRLTA
jgi:hypothetical protein